MQRPLLDLRVATALQEQLLGTHRIVDDFVEDLGHRVRVQPQLATCGDQPRQELLFAMRVAQLEILALLQFGDAGHQFAAPRQQFENLVVDRVDAVAKFLQVHGCPPCRVCCRRVILASLSPRPNAAGERVRICQEPSYRIVVGRIANPSRKTRTDWQSVLHPIR